LLITLANPGFASPGFAQRELDRSGLTGTAHMIGITDLPPKNWTVYK